VDLIQPRWLDEIALAYRMIPTLGLVPSPLPRRTSARIAADSYQTCHALYHAVIGNVKRTPASATSTPLWRRTRHIPPPYTHAMPYVVTPAWRVSLTYTVCHLLAWQADAQAQGASY